MILINCKLAPDLMCRVFPRSYHEATRAQFGLVPGAQWDPAEHCYNAPLEVAEIVLNTLERAGVARVTWDEELPGRPTEPEMPIPGGKLRPYQEDGARFLVGCGLETGSALLADDLGVGKTVQALTAAKWLANNGTCRVLIVCPAVVVEQWIEEGQKWIGQKITKIKPKEAEKWEHWGVISWDTLRNCYERLPSAYLVILDELHNASNSRSQRSHAVQTYLNQRPERPIVFGLTGTPMTARPRDLHHPLELLWPKRFGWFKGFTRRYCDGHDQEIQGVEYPVWNSDGASNLQELGVRLRRLMLRRTKAEVQPDLPERTRTMIPVELPAYAAKKLKLQVNLADTDGHSLRRMLANIEDHKLKAAIDLAKDLVAQGQKVLIYTLTRAAAKKIAAGLKTAYATGEQTPPKRKKELLRGAALRSCAVATLFSVTEGINYLTAFDTGIFVGLPWVPKDIIQPEGRIHRFGQEHSVQFYYLIGMRTIDEVIRSVIIERLESFAEVVSSADDERALAAELDASSGDLLKQIIQQAEEHARRNNDEG